MTEEIMSFEDFSLEITGRYIFDHFSLGLRRGEVHTIMSGRAYDLSNFSRLATGDMDLKRERIFFDGKPLPYAKLKNYSYAVTTRTGLFPEFSIPNNLYIHSRKWPRQIAAETTRVFKELGINIDPREKIDDLSLSERKILEIVRGYTTHAPVIILYETLYHIDGGFQELAISLIRKIAASGAGIFYVTSKLEDALRVSDRISVIENGRVIGCYDAYQVRKSPKHMMQLMTGLETERVDNQEMIEILGAIVGTRETLDSALELRGRLAQYAENIRRLTEAEVCTILISRMGGQEITISRPENGLLSLEIVKCAEKTCKEITVVEGEDIGVACPFQSLVYAPIFDVSASTLLGSITVGYRNKINPSQKEILILQAFAKDILVMLESARLKTRSLLLQESNHRIKNNLQMIVSLLYMQKRTINTEDTVSPQSINTLINDIVSRVKSIALVHQILTANGETNDSFVQVGTIIDGVVALYKNINAHVETFNDDIMLKYDKATFIALIINELVNNCVKHAFVGRDADDNRVNVSCRDRGEYVEIVTADNGVGMNGMEDNQSQSCGISIVKLAADSLGGTVEYLSEKGTTVTIRVPKENLL